LTTYTFTIPSPSGGASSLPASDTQAALDRLWGVDIWFDVNQDVPNYITTPAGDWLPVEGREALRQSLLRRYITSPGEYAVIPEYGAGARDYVKGRDTRAKRDELADRIRVQSLRDERVEAVQQITIDSLPDQAPGIKIYVLVIPKGRVRPDDVLPVVLTVTR
jgi:hypothetical protein